MAANNEEDTKQRKERMVEVIEKKLFSLLK